MIFNFHTEILSSPRGRLACEAEQGPSYSFLNRLSLFSLLCVQNNPSFSHWCAVSPLFALLSSYIYRDGSLRSPFISVDLFICSCANTTDLLLLLLLLQWLYNRSYSLVAQMVKNLPAVQETCVWSLGQEDPLEKGTPTSVILPGEFHGQRSLMGYSPWGHKESNMTERLTLSLYYLVGRCTPLFLPPLF